MVPPDRLTEVPPLVAETMPPQSVKGEALDVLFRLVGYVSVKATFLISVVFGLDSVIKSTDVAPCAMVSGRNCLVAEAAPST